MAGRAVGGPRRWLPQLAKAAGDVEWIGCYGNGERPLERPQQVPRDVRARHEHSEGKRQQRSRPPAITKPLHRIRPALLMAATGRYVSFIDDDMVPDDFVETILDAITWDSPEADVPDVIGFQVAYTCNGQPGPPCICSIRYEPGDRDGVLYRDLTHIQPVRTLLARQGDFRKGWPEDNSGATRCGRWCTARCSSAADCMSTGTTSATRRRPARC